MMSEAFAADRSAREPISRSSILVLICAAMLSGCNTPSGANHNEIPTPPVVMSVTAAKVAVTPIRSEMRLLGTTVANRHLVLRAPSAGRVLGLDIQSGDQVRRGQTVARVLNREVEAAQNGLAMAQKIDPANAAALGSSVDRYTHDPGVTVVVPEDAVVSQRLVTAGQLVNEMDPLADLIDPRSVYVDAALPVRALAQVRLGMSATVTSQLDSAVIYPARVVSISPNFSDGGTSTTARIEFTGGARIVQAGAPVEVTITTAFVPNAITVPAVALFENASNGSFYVFVAGPDGRARRTTVVPGIRSGDIVQTTAGLKPGETVITSGGYALSDGLRVNVSVAQN